MGLDIVAKALVSACFQHKALSLSKQMYLESSWTHYIAWLCLFHTVEDSGTIFYTMISTWDCCPQYAAGEHIGGGSPPRVDIAVDPLDGTTLTAQGRSGALAVSAHGETSLAPAELCSQSIAPDS